MGHPRLANASFDHVFWLLQLHFCPSLHSLPHRVPVLVGEVDGRTQPAIQRGVLPPFYKQIITL